MKNARVQRAAAAIVSAIGNCRWYFCVRTCTTYVLCVLLLQELVWYVFIICKLNWIRACVCVVK